MASYNIVGRVDLKPLQKASKAFAKFDKQTQMWSKHSRKAYLAVTTAASYYAQRVLRDSIKNALEDEKSQRVLALTLANVANATDAAVIATEQQIATMQAAYGVTDDLLRPALARLARSSGSASQAVYDLNLALDISAATGKSLEAVTGALGKALDGNYASLQRLGLGIDASVLKTKDQNKIFGQLRTTFANFARNEANTTEGRFRRIAVAADEAKEIIGVALVDSINNMVATQGDIEGLTKSFNSLAYAIGDTLRGMTQLTEKATSFTSRFRIDLVAAIPVLGSWIRGLQNIGKQQRINLAISKSQTQQIISARNAEYTALKAKKELTNSTVEGTKKTVDQLIAEEAARKAGFKITEDLDSIQTVAAAKRLEEARQYKMGLIDAAQAGYDALKSANDRLNMIFEAQKANFNVMKAVMELGINIPVTISRTTQNAIMGQSGYNPPDTATIGAILGQTSNYVNPDIGTRNAIMGQAPVNVTVNAGAVGNEQYLADLITRSITQANRSGISTTPAGALG